MTDYTAVAKDTLKILENKSYINTLGNVVDIEESLNWCIKNSELYKPNYQIPDVHESRTPTITVTNETTLEAAYRLRDFDVCVLNFASAKNPGGGWIWGSVAQEETIARASGLYSSLIKFPEYYEENKKSQAKNIGHYLNYAIYSPLVPVFRDDSCKLLNDPYTVSVVTSPAPNWTNIVADISDKCTENNKQDDSLFDDEYDRALEEVEDVLYDRMLQILTIMYEQEYRTIVLGAWGCGIFGNDPEMVTKLFKKALAAVPCFDEVVFAIYADKESAVYKAFEREFS
jgi:uncharacterized protein (TIGR02452 family)